MKGSVTNVVLAGLGGQGVMKASDILADAVFAAGYDVKKSEVHGMSQRGGSVTSDVRFGATVLSPMVPRGEADILVVLTADQVAMNRPLLASGGLLLSADMVDGCAVPNRRCMNVAMLGVLATCLDVDEAHWLSAIRANLPATYHGVNEEAFALGQAAGRARFSQTED